MYNDRIALLPNFIALGQTQAELYILKVEQLDACIRPHSQIQSQVY